MFKKWLAVLGAVVLLVCTYQLLWGGGDGEEYPWGTATGGTGGGTTVSSTANPRRSSPLTRIYIVRPAPMGGFYLMRISLPSDGSAKTAAGGKKVGN